MSLFLKNSNKKSSDYNNCHAIDPSIKFYTPEILLDALVINDIASNLTEDSRFLVFGLGHDSCMWFNLCPNTCFVEHNPKYINKALEYIPKANIVHCKYKGISVWNSFGMTEERLSSLPMPPELEGAEPFDVILIDGPTGYNFFLSGRMLPCYWAMKHFSQPGTLVYIDDSERKLESYCIDRFFKGKVSQSFPSRDGCVKIAME